MTYLVDANVLSEATKPHPSRKVVAWLRSNESQIAINPIILGEIQYGINLLPDGNRRDRLQEWFQRGVVKIHCLPWDASTGLRWAKLLATLRRQGKSMPIKDSLIAATALELDLVVVTHNVADFAHAGARIIDPFI